MKEYIVSFDFTTVHAKSRFVGRSGELSVNCSDEIDPNKDADELQSLIAGYIHSIKPKWNIFMINIKNITTPLSGTTQGISNNVINT